MPALCAARLQGCVARCAKASELVTVLEAMVALPAAFPVTSPQAAQLLAAVQAHAAATTGIDDRSKERMREILLGIGYGKADQYLAKMTSSAAAAVSQREPTAAKVAARSASAAAAAASEEASAAAEAEQKKKGKGRKKAASGAAEEAVAAAAIPSTGTSHASVQGSGKAGTPAAPATAAAGATTRTAAIKKKAAPPPSSSGSRHDTYDELLDIVSSEPQRQQADAEVGSRTAAGAGARAAAPHMAAAPSPMPTQHAAVPDAASDDEGNVSYDDDGELMVSSTRTRRRR